MRPISVNTKLVGLLGTPLAQSYSTACHNAVYGELGLDMRYLPIDIPDAAHFGAIVGGIRHMNFAGFALTKPYKETILGYLDEMDPVAQAMGSCNTVVVGENGHLKGYNTDGAGAITSLQLEGSVRFEDRTFFSFGAGGTGKSVCLEIASRRPKHIYIASRSAMCEQLASSINQLYPGTCTAIRMADTARVHQAVSLSDVLLNLSGLGMASHLDETPLDKAQFRPGHICFDATYNPAVPRFLREAAEAGCKTVNGLGMLAYQGSRQIQIWTGEPEPTEPMLRHLKALTGA